jgi:hypothetical protein
MEKPPPFLSPKEIEGGIPVEQIAQVSLTGVKVLS